MREQGRWGGYLKIPDLHTIANEIVLGMARTTFFSSYNYGSMARITNKKNTNKNYGKIKISVVEVNLLKKPYFWNKLFWRLSGFEYIPPQHNEEQIPNSIVTLGTTQNPQVGFTDFNNNVTTTATMRYESPRITTIEHDNSSEGSQAQLTEDLDEEEDIIDDRS